MPNPTKTTDDYKVGDKTQALTHVRRLGGDYYIGIDPATPLGDYGCITTWKKVSIWIRFLRWLHIDKSKWQYEIVSQEFVK